MQKAVILHDGRKAITDPALVLFQAGKERDSNNRPKPTYKSVKDGYIMASIEGHDFQPLNKNKIKEEVKPQF